MNWFRGGVVLACVVALAASASAPKPRTVKSSTTIAASPERVWDAVIDMFGERNWPILNLEKDSGIITTDWTNVGAEADAEAYADCGGAGLSTVLGTQVRFNVRVRGDGAGSIVAVGASFRQQRSYDGAIGYSDCVSKSAIEAMVHGQVRARVSLPASAAAIQAPTPATSLRGHFCATSSTSPAAGVCARQRVDCERSQAAISAVVADVSACSLVELAWCFDDGAERCFPNEPACSAAQARVSASSAPKPIAACGQRS